MEKISKFLLLIFIILAASSLILNEFAFAQSISKPSVPEFAVTPIGPSFDVPPVYLTDKVTGQVVIAENGYRIQYTAVIVNITNQSPTPSFYNVRIKGHNQPDNFWNELFNVNDGFLMPSKSNFTSIPIQVERDQNFGVVVATGAQTDIQVEAMNGKVERGFNGNATNQIEMYPYVFNGETSGWSNTQTITLPANIPLDLNPTPSPSSSATTAPTVTSNSILLPMTVFFLVLAAFITIIGSLILLLIRLYRKKPQS